MSQCEIPGVLHFMFACYLAAMFPLFAIVWWQLLKSFLNKGRDT